MIWRLERLSPDQVDEERALLVAIDEHPVAGHLLLNQDHAFDAYASQKSRGEDNFGSRHVYSICIQREVET